jgi:molybdenum cofactor biosynthesis enzyme MoaA
MSKNTICTIPWNHLAVMQNGEYGICCQCVYHAAGRLITDNKPENIKTKDLNEIRNHPMFVELRRSMMAGEKSPMCKLCWDEESLGIKSKRQNQQHIYRETLNKILEDTNKSGVIDNNEYPLNYLDLRLGNLCNLKCRTCGPGDSSLWIEDLYDTGSKTFRIQNMTNVYEIEKKDNTYKIKSDDFQYYNNEKFINNLKEVLLNIDRIYFTGGEPLINKQHYRILDYCIEKDLAKNITLEYNTNGTALNKNLLEQWKHFSQVVICFSIDGINDMAHYVRYPSNWKIIEQNIREIDNSELTNIQCTTNFTLNILNVKHFLEVLNWFHTKNKKKFGKKFHWHRLLGPIWLNLQILPEGTKNEITSLYEDFINNSDIPNIRDHIWPAIEFMNAADLSVQLPITKKRIDDIDKIRNQKLVDYVLWLAEVLENYKGIN